MSRLCYATKLMIQLHNLPNITTTLARIISTSAPEPNFGSRRMAIPAEPVRFTMKQQLLSGEPKGAKDTSSPSESNNKSNNSDGSANGPKPSNKDSKLPEVTIVDINGGYKHMDFEQRMEHMDRAYNMNNEEGPSDISPNLIFPLQRKISKVVDINGYGDDMMYEDKSAMESVPEPTETAKQEVPSSSEVGGSLENGDQQMPDTSASRQQDTRIVATDVKAAAFENSSNAKQTDSVAITVEKELTVQATNSCTSSGVETSCVAPVDIDAFADEEEKLQGTVDIDAYGDNERMKLPPIPKVRNNVFEFKGIKIVMPRRMLRDATYRYRLDPNDKDKPDDIQICVFEK